MCLVSKGARRPSQQFSAKSMQFGTVEMLAGRLGQRHALFDRLQCLGVVTNLQLRVC